MPVDDKDRARKVASSRQGAVLVDKCADDWPVPFYGITKSCRVRWEVPDNKAWSLLLPLIRLIVTLKNEFFSGYMLVYYMCYTFTAVVF